MQASATGAQSLDVYRGVNETHLHWKTPEEREKISDDMRQAGVGSVRVDLGAPFDKSIDSLDLLTRKHLSILLIVGFSEPHLVARDATRRPGRGPIWSVVPLSQLDPEFFREKFGGLWREIEQRRIRLTAIEAGNEINWAAFNGDLGLVPSHGQPPQGAPGSVALHDRAAYLLGLRRYVAAVAIIKQFRDASINNRDTKIISAGLASMPATFAANVGPSMSIPMKRSTSSRLTGSMQWSMATVSTSIPMSIRRCRSAPGILRICCAPARLGHGVTRVG